MGILDSNYTLIVLLFGTCVSLKSCLDLNRRIENKDKEPDLYVAEHGLVIRDIGAKSKYSL